MEIKYSIFDPTGNITALVETRVEPALQPPVADEIMKSHPAVEQVGFVYFEPGRPVPAMLRMAGGEFCGNAAMSTAVFYLMSSGEETDSVRVNVSGASMPVRVKIKAAPDGTYEAGVYMMPARSISKLTYEGAELSLVEMEGISHIIIEKGSPLYELSEDREKAEEAVKEICNMLGADGMGLMFLDAEESTMLPLVYVPASGTMFWENSCASGTTACGMYLADKEGAPVDITLREPGGSMRVSSNPQANETVLYGSTRILQKESMEYNQIL